ncbi:MAG: GDSL-type esterase/lipase family protein [Dehalococcoidia bacterium]|nr:GDSL-type esterase/lipase family protein [Dehalococcoidia bacterium]
MKRRTSTSLVLVVVAFALAGLSLFRISGHHAEPAAAAASPRFAYLPGLATDGIVPTHTPTPRPTPTPTPPPRVGPTSPQGVRIWADGDSTSYFVTVGLFNLFEANGGVAVREPDYQKSSGLISGGLDWFTYAASEMTTYAPDVAVLMLGANDAVVINSVGTERYRERVGAMMDLLRAPNRLVVWVGQPAMGRDDLAANVPVVNAIARDEATRRPWVLYVDTTAVTTGADGQYTPYLRDADGSTVLGRSDKVHFTPAGGRIVADAVFAAIFSH